MPFCQIQDASDPDAELIRYATERGPDPASHRRESRPWEHEGALSAQSAGFRAPCGPIARQEYLEYRHCSARRERFGTFGTRFVTEGELERS